jgi:peptide/nickel transport system permease protein
MRMFDYILRRLISSLLVILIIAITLFLIFYMFPSNPAQLSCGKPCSPEQLRRVSAFMGTDQPWYAQLGAYLLGIFAGRTFGTGASAVVCAAPCLGYSFRLNEPVTTLIAERFPVTASIAMGAAVLWIIIGVGTGVLAAVKRNTWVDRLLMALSAIGISSPSYLIGLLAIIVFAFELPVFPSGGYVPFSRNPAGWFSHLLLPWLVLALINAASYTRITRTQMIGEMEQDYIRTERSKGAPESVVVGRHALRNALLPVMTMFGLDLGSLLGGAVLTERVFSMQGLGMLLLDSVTNLDLQVLVGSTLFAAALVIVANLVVDICYSFLDPRVTVRR